MPVFRFSCWVLQILAGCSLLVPGGVAGAQQGMQPPAEPGGPRELRAAVIPGDFADPSVIRVGTTYYATGTSSEWAPHFPVFTSSNLLDWKPAGYVFPRTPEWAASAFWAPELFYAHGIFYVYYVAKRKSDGVSCIGVATSRNPGSGFTDRGIVVQWGREAIDPYVVEEEGRRYITWKAYGLDDRPIELLACRLSADGLRLEGAPFTLLRDSLRQGLEGQCFVRKGNYFYLFYSVGACCGRQCNYRVHVARAPSLRGTFVPYGSNPVLDGDEYWKCPGHGTVVSSGTAVEYYLYHAYHREHDVFTGRQGLLQELLWDETTGWPSFKMPAGDHGVAGGTLSFQEDFSRPRLSHRWQWDFREAPPRWQIREGSLYLSGETGRTNRAGTVLTVRPFTGNYTVATRVENRNSSVKGLALYGEASRCVGIGTVGDRVVVWAISDNHKTVMAAETLPGGGEVDLRMQVAQGYQCRFFWRLPGGAWHEIKAGSGGYYDGRSLPPWDRSPRPGLHHFGSGEEPARFAFFSVSYE